MYFDNTSLSSQGPDDPKPSYDFEITTNFFKIDEEGFLVVGEDNLDRDPPSPGKFRFQVNLKDFLRPVFFMFFQISTHDS